MQLKAMAIGALLALGAEGILGTGGVAAEAEVLSAERVKEIMQANRANWLRVWEFNGEDRLIFTFIASYRCGLEEVLYGINGETPAEPLPMEPCHEGSDDPAAMDPVRYPRHVALPLGSLESVSLIVMYGDGEIDEVSFQRADILR